MGQGLPVLGPGAAMFAVIVRAECPLRARYVERGANVLLLAGGAGD